MTEEAGLDPNRQIMRLMRVEFMVGPHGPFTQRFPLDGFNPDNARRELDEFARKIGALVR